MGSRRTQQAHALPASVETTAAFADAPPEVFDAVRFALDTRSRHAVEAVGANSLTAFMAVERPTLLALPCCGRTTVDRISLMQTRIAEASRRIDETTGDFRAADLLGDPCLTAPVVRRKGDAPEVAVLADTVNPTPWLQGLVRRIAKTERHARVFMLRHGMLGAPPVTLARVGRQTGGMTRERIRQMQLSVERRLAAPYQQHRLRPLLDEIVAAVERNGGMVTLGELTQAVLCRGEGGYQLRHATSLMSLLIGFPACKEAGIRVHEDGAVSAASTHRTLTLLASVIADVALASADERLGDDLWSVERGRLKASLARDRRVLEAAPRVSTASDALLDAVLSRCDTGCRAQGERVYSFQLWQLRFGSWYDMLEAILIGAGRPMDYAELVREAQRWQPDRDTALLRASVRASPDILRWDNGTYVHRHSIAVPRRLTIDVERWLLGALAHAGCVFVGGAYRQFQAQCDAAGVPSEMALYACLKASSSSVLAYLRWPHVSLRTAGETVTVTTALEQFLRDAGGPVTEAQLMAFATDRMFLRRHNFNRVRHHIPNVVRTADGGFLHKDNRKREL